MTSGRCTPEPAPGSGPSFNRLCNLTMIDVPNGAGFNPASQCLAWGTAAAAPAVFSDLGSSSVAVLSSTSLSTEPSTSKYTSIRTQLVGTPGAVGLHVWLCYINSIAVPIAGTVIDAAVDVGAINAL